MNSTLPGPGCRTLVSITLLALMALCGCRTAPPERPLSSRSEFRREHDPAFSARDRNLIRTARLALEQTEKKPTDVFYRVRPKDNGYEVFALYVAGYEGEKPVFKPCNDCAVMIAQDGSVREILTGPAAWP